MSWTFDAQIAAAIASVIMTSTFLGYFVDDAASVKPSNHQRRPADWPQIPRQV